MQFANTLLCDLLIARGFKGELLKAEIKKKSEVPWALLTVTHSREQVEALAKASTHGAIFALTGGNHFTSDNMFKAAELPHQKAQIAEMKKEKKEREAGIEKDSKVKSILEVKKEINSLTGDELTSLLRWHGAKKASEGKVEERRRKWRKIVKDGVQAPAYAKWTDEDKAALALLEKEPISIKDTALGRLQEQHKKELLATFKALPPNEKADFLKELNGGEAGEGKEEEGGEEAAI